jgi:hypothetical protein
MVAGQRIHQGILEGVPHVQAAGDIRRRDHDAIGFAFAGRRKVSFLLPGFVPVLFDSVRVVSLFHVWLYSVKRGRLEPKRGLYLKLPLGQGVFPGMNEIPSLRAKRGNLLLWNQ